MVAKEISYVVFFVITTLLRSPFCVLSIQLVVVIVLANMLTSSESAANQNKNCHYREQKSVRARGSRPLMSLIGYLRAVRRFTQTLPSVTLQVAVS